MVVMSIFAISYRFVPPSRATCATASSPRPGGGAHGIRHERRPAMHVSAAESARHRHRLRSQCRGTQRRGSKRQRHPEMTVQRPRGGRRSVIQGGRRSVIDNRQTFVRGRQSVIRRRRLPHRLRHLRREQNAGTAREEPRNGAGTAKQCLSGTMIVPHPSKKCNDDVPPSLQLSAGDRRARKVSHRRRLRRLPCSLHLLPI